MNQPRAFYAEHMQRERLVTWETPERTLEAVRRSSGIDALRALVDGSLPRPPISALMNFALTEVEEGRVVVLGHPGEEHYNPIGAVHGGFALTIFDTAMSCAVHSLLSAGTGYTTTDVQVRFIRAITLETGTVRCEGVALHTGRSTAVAEGKLYDAAGKLLGVGTTACQILRG